MTDYEGYCERCGKALARVGLCGRCQQTADLLSTIADLREEVKQLKAALAAEKGGG